jgi:hypothetical protein
VVAALRDIKIVFATIEDKKNCFNYNKSTLKLYIREENRFQEVMSIVRKGWFRNQGLLTRKILKKGTETHFFRTLVIDNETAKLLANEPYLSNLFQQQKQ